MVVSRGSECEALFRFHSLFLFTTFLMKFFSTAPLFCIVRFHVFKAFGNSNTISFILSRLRVQRQCPFFLEQNQRSFLFSKEMYESSMYGDLYERFRQGPWLEALSLELFLKVHDKFGHLGDDAVLHAAADTVSVIALRKVHEEKRVLIQQLRALEDQLEAQKAETKRVQDEAKNISDQKNALLTNYEAIEHDLNAEMEMKKTAQLEVEEVKTICI